MENGELIGNSLDVLPCLSFLDMFCDERWNKTLLLCAELMVSTLGSRAKLHISTLEMG